MRVEVDRVVCGLNGECVLAAPDVFRLDDEGELAYAASPDESQRAAVEEAVDACPMQAISLRD